MGGEKEFDPLDGPVAGEEERDLLPWPRGGDQEVNFNKKENKKYKKMKMFLKRPRGWGKRI